MLSAMLFAFAHTGDSHGRFFYSPMTSDAYEIHAFDSAGEELFAIHQDMPMVEKTESEMEDESIFIESWMSKMGAGGHRTGAGVRYLRHDRRAYLLDTTSHRKQ